MTSTIDEPQMWENEDVIVKRAFNKVLNAGMALQTHQKTLEVAQANLEAEKGKDEKKEAEVDMAEKEVDDATKQVASANEAVAKAKNVLEAFLVTLIKGRVKNMGAVEKSEAGSDKSEDLNREEMLHAVMKQSAEKKEDKKDVALNESPKKKQRKVKMRGTPTSATSHVLEKSDTLASSQESRFPLKAFSDVKKSGFSCGGEIVFPKCG